MRILIVGITGFSGRHLTKYLVTQGQEVFGISSGRHQIDAADWLNKHSSISTCDLADIKQLHGIIENTSPDYVFHLAADNSARLSGFNPKACFQVNVFGTFNLLESIRKAKCDPVILVPGSSAQFGLVPEEENPIVETTPFRPVNPYGVSKISQAMTAYQYYLSYGLKVIRTNTFNILGPGQPDTQMPAAFAKQIVAIENGQQTEMTVGNLETLRDMTDIRDVVRAYWLISRHSPPGEIYNVCSGISISGREILQHLTALSHCPINIKQGPIRRAAYDVPIQQGNYDKLNCATGWKPEIPLEQTLKDVINEWRFRRD